MKIKAFKNGESISAKKGDREESLLWISFHKDITTGELNDLKKEYGNLKLSEFIKRQIELKGK